MAANAVRWPMRAISWAVACSLLAVVLAGCSGSGTDDPGGPGAQGTQPPDGPAGAEAPLRFAPENRTAVQENYTVTIGPQDACIPAGCALLTATGGDPAFIKPIDISDVLPDGMHAQVDAQASWDRTAPAALFGRMNLQWFTFDSTVSHVDASASDGQAQWSGVVTQHGPEPAQLILVVIEPEAFEAVEVNVQVTVTPFDDGVHATHVVAAELAGGAVDFSVESEGGNTTVHVRGPDESPVLTASVADGNLSLPAGSPAGTYRFVTFGHDGPAKIRLPEGNLSTAGMATVDTSPVFGEARELPAEGTVTWEVDLQRPPYQVAVWLDALHGPAEIRNGRVDVTAPDGSQVLDASFTCSGCLYSFMSIPSDLAMVAFTPGTYTFTVQAEAEAGWQIYEGIRLYGA